MVATTTSYVPLPRRPRRSIRRGQGEMGQGDGPTRVPDEGGAQVAKKMENLKLWFVRVRRPPASSSSFCDLSIHFSTLVRRIIHPVQRCSGFRIQFSIKWRVASCVVFVRGVLVWPRPTWERRNDRASSASPLQSPVSQAVVRLIDCRLLSSTPPPYFPPL